MYSCNERIWNIVESVECSVYSEFVYNFVVYSTSPVSQSRYFISISISIYTVNAMPCSACVRYAYRCFLLFPTLTARTPSRQLLIRSTYYEFDPQPPLSSPLPSNHVYINNNSDNNKNPLGHSNDCRLEQASERTNEQANNIPFQSHFIRMFSPRILLLSTYHMLRSIHSVCSSSKWLHQCVVAAAAAVVHTIYTLCIYIKRVARLYNIYEHMYNVYRYTRVHTQQSRNRNKHNQTFWPWNLT